MKATDELCRLLGARGIGYKVGHTESVISGGLTVVSWQGRCGQQYDASNGSRSSKGLVYLSGMFMSPKRTVDVTLGETCHIEGPRIADTLEHDCPEFILYCDECGHGFGYIHYGENGNVWTSEVPRYCPNCGRKVFQP